MKLKHKGNRFRNLENSILALFLVFVVATHGNDHLKQRVLLVSYDGFRWNYLDKISNKVNFERIINAGVYAKKGLQNAFITKTFPNHYTLVTGLYEESHGIVANEMYDPQFNETFSLTDPEDVIKSKWFDDGGEPIWVTNQKQSTPSLPRRSGSLFWPGSMASVHGYLPTKYLAYDPHMKFKERVDIIISWFLDKDPIDLGLLYYEHPDEEGHEYGPESDNMAETIQKLEACTGYLLDSLEKNNLLDTMNVILTSDHGMTTTPHNKTIILGDYIQKDLYKVIVMNNPIVSIIPQNKTAGDIIVSKLQNVAHLEVYKKSDIPQEYHYSKNRRILDILIVADLGYTIVESYHQKYTGKGDHGYNNSLPDMHPFFMAMGPAFRVNHTVETFNNVDVYPLICQILGIEPAPNNGSMDIVQGLLKPKKERKLYELDNTFLVYLVILSIGGIFGGIFTIGACRQRRFHRHGELTPLPYKRPTASYSPVSLSQNGPSLPLLSDDTEEEF